MGYREGAILCFSGALCLLGVLCLCISQGGKLPDPESRAQAEEPPPSKPGAHVSSRRQSNWTHKELFEYLKSKGAVDAQAPSRRGAYPAMYFFANTPPHTAQGLLDHGRSLDAGEPPSNATALVQKLPTEEQARDYAGSLGDRGLSWGRFAFQGHPAMLARIKAALEGRDAGRMKLESDKQNAVDKWLDDVQKEHSKRRP